MKTVYVRDAVMTYGIKTESVITMIHKLRSRIKYEGEGAPITDRLEDAENALCKAIDILTDVEGDLDYLIDHEFNELEEEETYG